MIEDPDAMMGEEIEFRPRRPESADTEEAGPAPAPPKPAFTNLVDFVQNRLVIIYRRVPDSSTRRWCPEWWRHDEAVLRLFALWRAYEALRRDDNGLGLSNWWLQHADPHMRVLMSVDGPFELCKKGHKDGDDDGNPHYGIAPLPHVEADREAFAALGAWTDNEIDRAA
ncbi:DUF4913 domain-containing protein [Nocardia yunnanensis]|uniref:DUF4913 domain-containing protein n=1 Tax=Nocardia yunnanensis TaxID=2382165 RepID=A0A386ZD77_9NOCA|nr:DUF4913 domain-containing protein [Nocardia yunnanensis]AYF75297.1 DUF4913 domain-containing protein [Nocardia yunnanensis]